MCGCLAVGKHLQRWLSLGQKSGEQTKSDQSQITKLFDESDLYSDQLQIMYMQEHLISNHPYVQ